MKIRNSKRRATVAIANVGANVSRERWEQIFGSDEDRRKRNAKEKAAKDKEAAKKVREVVGGPHVSRINEMILTNFDYGAGRQWNTLHERREWMKRRGVHNPDGD